MAAFRMTGVENKAAPLAQSRLENKRKNPSGYLPFSFSSSAMNAFGPPGW